MRPTDLHMDEAGYTTKLSVSYIKQAADRSQPVQKSNWDEFRTCLLLIDPQRDFCLPDAPLFVGGRSGRGAVDDSIKISRFIYDNLEGITEIISTMDTHYPNQIFFNSFWAKNDGTTPAPFTVITVDDLDTERVFLSNIGLSGRGRVGDSHWAIQQARHYVEELKRAGKYSLILWPYHCLAGTDGHGIMDNIQHARLYHAFMRGSDNRCIEKGALRWAESYSVFGPEVTTAWTGETLYERDNGTMDALLQNDAIIIAGEAASHCVKSSVDDLADYIIQSRGDPSLFRKIYILRDCMSAVVSFGPDGTPIEGLDFTAAAEAAFSKWAGLGMNVVDSSVPMKDWLRRPSL